MSKNKGGELVSPGYVGADNNQTTDFEGAGMTGDSKALETGFRAVTADAEILMPGINLPTFDAAARRSVTMDSMCATRRAALTAAHMTTDGKAVIDTIRGATGTLDVAAMTCVDAAMLFRAAAGAKKLLNNRTATGDRMAAPQGSVQQQIANAPKKMTISDLQAINRKIYPTDMLAH
jgi:hypothetical protein